MKIRIWTIAMVCCIMSILSAQQKTDSLLIALKKAKSTEEKCGTILLLSVAYLDSDPEKAASYALEYIELAKENPKDTMLANVLAIAGIGYKDLGKYEEALNYHFKSLKEATRRKSEKNKAIAYQNIGNVYDEWGKYDKAIEYFSKANESYEMIKDLKGQAFCLNGTGIIYRKQGKYENAINYIQEAVKLFEVMKDSTGIGQSYNNIANIYNSQKAYDKALEFYEKCYDIFKRMNHINGMFTSLNNIGIIYYYKEDFEMAIKYYNNALAIARLSGNKKVIAYMLNNIGLVLRETGDNDQAHEYLVEAAGIMEEIQDTPGIIRVYSNLACIYQIWGQMDKALKYCNDASDIAGEDANPEDLKQIYESYSQIYEKMGNYREAFRYEKLFGQIKDTLYNKETFNKIEEIQTKYETEKKEQEIVLLQKDKKLQDLEILRQQDRVKKQRILIITFISGFVMIVFFAVWILRLFIQKRKANLILAKQKEEIMTQKEEIQAQRDLVIAQRDKIEEINREMTDSIRYAKRIQSAILPDENRADSLFPDHCIFFRPRDIVSGDFYWMTKVEEQLVVAVADCTGHGVPGAFMSMLGAAFLNDIVNKEYITQPGLILKKLRKEVINALQQKGESPEGNMAGNVKDGMDIVICSIDMKNKILQFAGANNPIYVVRENDVPLCDGMEPNISAGKVRLYEVKGDKMPIAIYERMDNFTTVELKLTDNDRIYMFSDGFADQFGGPAGKKYKYKTFKEFLLNISGNPMNKQSDMLEKELNNWKQGHEQVDDVTVVGIKVP